MDILHLPSVLGGVLVGLAAVTLLVRSGRIAGISGILGGLLDGEKDRAFRLAFLGALLLVGVSAALWAPAYVPSRPTETSSLVLGGLFVGFGTRLGNGCTSGHGVCGVGRLSPRSMLATAIFVGVGMGTVVAMRVVLGAP